MNHVSGPPGLFRTLSKKQTLQKREPRHPFSDVRIFLLGETSEHQEAKGFISGIDFSQFCP